MSGDPVEQWVAWYIETAQRTGQTSLIAIFQAHQRGRLAGGAESLQRGIQGFINSSVSLFTGIASAYLRAALEASGCPREETAAIESAGRVAVINGLLRHLTDHASELPDCVSVLPPDFLLPPS